MVADKKGRVVFGRKYANVTSDVFRGNVPWWTRDHQVSTRGFERQVVRRASRTTSLNGDTVIRGHVGVDAPREQSFFRNRLITLIYGSL